MAATSSRLARLLALSLLACHATGEPGRRERDSVEFRAHGETLYQMHCAVCHGTGGRGDGDAARYLFPPARDFTSGRFRLVSSENAAPFDEDLVATLRRGIPGTAMPAWSWLEERDLWALAGHVRFLAVEGLGESLAAEGQRIDDPLLTAEAPRIARARLTPDAHQSVPAGAGREPIDLERGRALFLRHCSECHGKDGRGVVEPRTNEDGTLNWARDLTAGFLKGGDSPAELACRIRCGMPGSAMPPTELAPADERALIAYVRELVPDGAAERLVHRRSTLEARRVTRVPSEPDDPAWSATPGIDVVLAPLWWHADAVLGARLAAVHDGERVALRLSWLDATGDIRLFAGATQSDGAALQLSPAARPALFGMGAPGEPTNLLHWQALRIEDVAEALDMLDPIAHAAQPTDPGVVRADVPRYERVFGRLQPSRRVDRISVQGVPSIAGASRLGGEARAEARWQDGEWSVVFLRPLAATEPDQVELRAGGRLQVACAIWNGAAGDSGARKSISIWQELVLAR